MLAVEPYEDVASCVCVCVCVGGGGGGGGGMGGEKVGEVVDTALSLHRKFTKADFIYKGTT